MSRLAIFPGTFDPITNGHVDLVSRATRLFPNVIVAIAANSRKRPCFSLEQRIAMAQMALKNISNVEIASFDTLLTAFAKQQNASVIIRGLRAVTDFEYECQLAHACRELMPELEIIFLPATGSQTFVTSTLVREIIAYGGDVTPFVPKTVADAINHYAKNFFQK